MGESISLVAFIYGVAIVIAFGAALLIKLIVGGLSYWENRKAAPAPMAAATAPAADAAIPSHHLVVIAAAAQAMLGAHRILHIGAESAGPVWSAEGRLVQHSSHRPGNRR